MRQRSPLQCCPVIIHLHLIHDTYIVPDIGHLYSLAQLSFIFILSMISLHYVGHKLFILSMMSINIQDTGKLCSVSHLSFIFILFILSIHYTGHRPTLQFGPLIVHLHIINDVHTLYGKQANSSIFILSMSSKQAHIIRETGQLCSVAHLYLIHNVHTLYVELSIISQHCLTGRPH